MRPRSRLAEGGSSPPRLLAGRQRSYGLAAIGGGTGLACLLSGLKREFGGLPLGDIRNCIAVLADDEYRQQGARSVETDRQVFAERGMPLVEVDLLADGPLVRHDPHKLAHALVDLAAGREARVV